MSGVADGPASSPAGVESSVEDLERDKTVADAIKAGRCPFGMLDEAKGQTIAHCPLGFPGCGCGDELMLNPYLIRQDDGEGEGDNKAGAK